ncbi:GNAT family N-acetyltransferase [Paracoccaceae bacterium GXU_MW_L88]
MSEAETIEITTIDAIARVDPAEWDALTEGHPFVSHRFLHALEESGSTGESAGWVPYHLLARQNGKLLGAMPLYLKYHSYGEYVFDHGWADAWERAGGRYYPKLQTAVPFTPVTGPRLLGPEPVQRALLQGARQITDNAGLSSFHMTFCREAEAELAEEAGFLLRLGQQFHWHNHDYADFDAFLAALSSRKRKAIRKERAQANSKGLTIETITGDAFEAKHWDAMWRFYQDTGRRKWGSPYLTREFFEIADATLRDDMLLIYAEGEGRPIAGALNVIGPEALYGRYWGAVAYVPALHFELCYYRAIDEAIARRLPRVEAGAQGEHKLARGYLPTPTHSVHYLPNPSFAQAVSDYLEAERAAIGEDVEVLTAMGPFRKETRDETE